MIDELEAPAGDPVEAPHVGGDNRRRRQLCELCDPPKMVGNLPSHQQQAHGTAPSRRPKRDKAPAKRAGAGALPSLRAELEATYMMIGQVWAIKDPVCGGALMQLAPDIAARWDAYARSNEAVHRWVSTMMAGGGLFGVVAAHLPLAVIVVQHHGPAAQAQRQWEQEQQEAARMAAEAAANGAGGNPFAVPADQAYGPYAPGQADAAR